MRHADYVYNCKLVNICYDMPLFKPYYSLIMLDGSQPDVLYSMLENKLWGH